MYGFRLNMVKYEKAIQPYRYKFWVQYLDSSKDFQHHIFNIDTIAENNLRIINQLAFRRDVNAKYYGYGNHHDIRKIKRITGEQGPIVPVGVNLGRNLSLKIN